jgi:hypothetical protein
MSYVFNLIVEVFLVLTYDLRSVDRTMNDIYVKWVAGLEVKMATSVSRLPVHFRGQFWTPHHNQHVQEWKGIKSLNFHNEFYGGRPTINSQKITPLLTTAAKT